MDNISHCAVIRYPGLKGSTPKEIHEDMVVTVGEDAHSNMAGIVWKRDSLEEG